MDRSWNDSVLRVMLSKIPKNDIVDSFIAIINTICKEDKDLKEMTHVIVTYCQVYKLRMMNDEFLKAELDKYQEPHRTELIQELIKLGRLRSIQLI